MKHLLAFLLLLVLVAHSWAAKAAAPAQSARQTQIRVLVALGPSSYFFRGGRPHGLEYSWLLEFEKFINQSKNRHIKLQFIPTDQGELIPALLDGQGDMAAGLLPASEGLRRLTALTEPFLTDHWCLASGRGQKPLKDMDDVAVEGVVQPSSSYARRLLLDVNETRRQEGKPEIIPKDAGVNVTAEMLLGEINAGSEKRVLTSRLVVDLWKRIFPKVNTGICLDAEVPLVWAVQPENQTLLADLNRFITANKSQLVKRGVMQTQAFLHPTGVKKPSSIIDPFDKLAFFAPVFQMAASASNLDWLLLAAIGQRETGLSEMTRKNGPTGVMQMSPLTARSMGVKDPHETSQNVTAAARYLDYLRQRFSSPDISAEDRLYFMIAAYNAGEGGLQNLRRKAAAQGLNPNRWHGHVEAAAQGSRVVNYVTAVSRYYLAYQSAERKRDQEHIHIASHPAALQAKN